MGTPRAREARVWVGPAAATRQDRRRRRRAIEAIAAQAETLTSVYEAELFTSSLLGRLWERRTRVPELKGVDPDVVLCSPIVEGLAAHGGAGARLVLHGISRLAPGAVATLCAKLAGDTSDALPVWAAEIGCSRVIDASVEHAPGDGEAIVLEVRGAGMINHAVAVYIDERVGGIAKHLGLIYSAPERPPDLRALATERSDARSACSRVREAIARTDAWPEAPVGERFADLRAIALIRTNSVLPAAAASPSLN